MKQCRICLDEEENIEDLIVPCQCDGTQKYVHTKCLERWRQESIDNINYTRCQECLTDYKIEKIGNKSFCFKINQYNIRCLYFIVLKTTFISVILYYIFFYLLGFIFIQISKLFGLSTSFYVDKLMFEDSFILIPTIGSIIISIFNVISYNILSCFMAYYRKDMNWTTTNNINIKKLNSIQLCTLFINLFSPIFGLFINCITIKFSSVFFFEYFFNKYLSEETRVINLDNDSDSGLLIV